MDKQNSEHSTLEDMLSSLRELANETTSSQWYKSLNQRKRAELEFHNRDRDSNFQASITKSEKSKYYGNKKYYLTTGESQRFIHNWLVEHCKDKVVLDYACGDGAMSCFIASETEALFTVGLDISDVSIENARGQVDNLDLREKVFFIQGDCENTKLPDNTFDIIYCCGMLHHLDLSYAFPEMRRILKPGGKIIAVEALAYNPLIRLYRILTPEMRTEWEKKHILSLSDITFARRFFSVGEIRYWHITSMLAAPFSKHEKVQFLLLKIFNSLDFILTRIPFVQLLAWQFTFELIKETES